MSHQVEQMMYVGQTPWHGLGVALESAPTTREAIVAAGLDWKVGLKALRTVDGIDVSHRALYRESDGRIYDVVPGGWRPLQNEEAFAWFDPFLASGLAKLETAGSLRHGKRVWILAAIDAAPSTIVPGDDVKKYVLLSNAHQGGIAVRVGFTPVRVVCANTLAMAHGDEASKLLRINHDGGMKATLDKVRETMSLANAAFEATAEQYRFLAKSSLREGDLEKYVQQVFAPKPVKDEATGELVTKVPPVILERVKSLLETGAGNQMPGVRGTMWSAYNALTDYLSHGRGRDAELRLDKLWFGDAANLNSRALEVAVRMAA